MKKNPSSGVAIRTSEWKKNPSNGVRPPSGENFINRVGFTVTSEGRNPTSRAVTSEGTWSGVQTIDKLDTSAPSGKNLSSGVAIQHGPDRGKQPGVHPSVGQMRRACKLVFVFPSREDLISETSNGNSERENSYNEIGSLSGRNPTSKGFNSRRLIEKRPVGKSVLPSPSEKNSISGAYRHSPLSEKTPAGKYFRVREVPSVEHLTLKDCNG